MSKNLIELISQKEEFDRVKGNKTIGRDQAEIEMFKRLYLEKYKLAPLEEMKELMQEVENLRVRRIRDYALITFNPIEGVKQSEINDHAFSLMKRTWVKKLIIIAREYRDIEDMSGFHLHCIVKLHKYYSPKEIARFLYNGKWKKNYGSCQAIDVKKFDSFLFRDKLEYVEKQNDVLYRLEEK